MKNLITKRLALTLALSGAILPLAIVGCGGGNNGVPSATATPTATTQPPVGANLDFTGSGASTANTTDINLSGIVTDPVATSIGIHAGLSDFISFNEYHVILFDRADTIRRAVRVELRAVNRAEVTDPIANTVYQLDGGASSRIIYTERPDGATTTNTWSSFDGTATITNVTPTAYTVTLSDTSMRNNSDNTDAFNIRGSIVVQKSQIGIEPDATYHNHQNGLPAALPRVQSAPIAH